ncbi:MAG: hypothetical protein ACREPI_08935 [Candidatus Dormibacterales bacterium]
MSKIVSVGRRRWVTGLAVTGGILELAVLLVILIPVVPPSLMHSAGVDRVNPDMANMIGWPQMVDQVGAVYNSLPTEERANTAILASIDGQAGALDIYGGPMHLPQAISPHLNFWYWKPTHVDATTLVTVGYEPSDLAFLCGTITRAATVTIPYAIVNLNQGTPILVCTNLREPIDVAWPALRNFG